MNNTALHIARLVYPVRLRTVEGETGTRRLVGLSSSLSDDRKIKSMGLWRS